MATLHEIENTPFALNAARLVLMRCYAMLGGSSTDRSILVRHIYEQGALDLGITAFSAAYSTQPGYSTALCGHDRAEVAKVAWDDSIHNEIRLMALWRLETDLNLDPPALPASEEHWSKGDVTVNQSNMDSLRNLYESLSGCALEPWRAGSPNYLGCGSPLFQGLTKLPSGTGVDLVTFADSCRVAPKDRVGAYGNTDSGLVNMLEAFTTKDAGRLTELLLTDWADRSHYAPTGGMLDTHDMHTFTKFHPMEPDAAIVARWRLENGIGI